MGDYIVNSPAEIGSSGNAIVYSGTNNQTCIGGNNSNLTLSGAGCVAVGGSRTTTVTGDGNVTVSAGGTSGLSSTDTNLVTVGGSGTTLAGSGSMCIGHSTDAALFQPTNPHLYLKGLTVDINHNTVYNTPSTITASDLCGGNIEFTSSGSYTLPTTANIAIELLDVNSNTFSSNIFPIFKTTFYNNTAGTVTLNFGTGQTYSGGSSITFAAGSVKIISFVFNTISSILVEYLEPTIDTLTNAGTTSLVNSGTGPALALKGLTTGTGVSLSNTTTDVTVTNNSPASSVTLTNAGTTTIVNDTTGPTLALKGLVAGTGVSLSNTATNVTVTNSSLASSVTLTNAGTTTIVNSGTGPSLTLKGLVAGTEISLTNNTTDVTVTNNSLASSVTLTNSGTTTIVNSGTGPALSLKGLVAGTEISLTNNTTDVTVTNSSPASSVTLTNAGTTTLVNTGTGPSLALKGLVAGTGVTLTNTATNVTVTNNSPASSVTLTNAGTTTLVNSGTGPALALKGLIAGTSVSFVETATDVTINGNVEPYYTSGSRAIVSGSSNTSTIDSTAGAALIGGRLLTGTITSAAVGGVAVGGASGNFLITGPGSVAVGSRLTSSTPLTLQGNGCVCLGTSNSSSDTSVIYGDGAVVIGGSGHTSTKLYGNGSVMLGASNYNMTSSTNGGDGCVYIGGFAAGTSPTVTTGIGYDGFVSVAGCFTQIDTIATRSRYITQIGGRNVTYGYSGFVPIADGQVVIGPSTTQMTIASRSSSALNTLMFVRANPLLLRTTSTFTGTSTMSPSQLASGMLLKSTTGSATLTLPTPSNVWDQFINSSDPLSTAVVATVFYCWIRAGTTGTVTVATNTNVTLSGTLTITANLMRLLTYVITDYTTAFANLA